MVKTRYSRKAFAWPSSILRMRQNAKHRFDHPWISDPSGYTGHVKRVFWFLWAWEVWDKYDAMPCAGGFAIGRNGAKAGACHAIYMALKQKPGWMDRTWHARHLRSES
jgi:hypothetical protein